MSLHTSILPPHTPTLRAGLVLSVDAASMQGLHLCRFLPLGPGKNVSDLYQPGAFGADVLRHAGSSSLNRPGGGMRGVHVCGWGHW